MAWCMCNCTCEGRQPQRHAALHGSPTTWCSTAVHSIVLAAAHSVSKHPANLQVCCSRWAVEWGFDGYHCSTLHK